METAGKLSASYVVIGVKEKIGYGFGDFASNLSFGFVSLFLLFFYTDMMGISAAYAAGLFLFIRFFDAIAAPAFGIFIDKVNTPWGKYKPWFIGVAIFAAEQVDLAEGADRAQVHYDDFGELRRPAGGEAAGGGVRIGNAVGQSGPAGEERVAAQVGSVQGQVLAGRRLSRQVVENPHGQSRDPDDNRL